MAKFWISQQVASWNLEMQEAQWHVLVQLEHGVAVTFLDWFQKIVLTKLIVPNCYKSFICATKDVYIEQEQWR